MISTRQSSPKPKNDDYARLANYIADASHEGEKCLATWNAGCLADDDYQLGISEVIATQACNERTTKEKTYHLIVSFRPEDESKLSTDDFKDIEKCFAEVLGFEEHQRHCGVHINTANPHMHVAYNMIHPEKKTRHAPYYDYWKRDELCRKLEKEYKITIDPGRKRRQELHKYVVDKKNSILPAVAAARTWEDIHASMASYGLSVSCKEELLIAPFEKNSRGSRIVGHDVHVSLNKQKLEERLGAYQAKKKFYPAQEEFIPSSQDEQRDKNEKAEVMEAYTGQESFDGYLKRHKDIIDSARASALSWQEFQNILQDELNITIKERGRGAVVADLGTRGKSQPHAKLSCLGREYSRARLEADFGKLERLNEGRKSTPKKGYESKPLHRDPERGKLYQEYQLGIKKRKKMFEQQKEQRKQEASEQRLKWKIKIKKYRIDSTLNWKEKRYLVNAIKAEQLRHEELLKKKYANRRAKIKEEIPYGNWNEFLRQKAEAGNMEALAVLQSSKTKEKAAHNERPVDNLLEGMTYTVDNEGNITYKLKNGGVVRDCRKDIYASSDVEAKRFAEELKNRRFTRKHMR
ncbi:relaxase/mobilization nuclease domain-containing protein [Halodesulfovibrio marinisediminis]|uniref:Relaxase/Mobilisation nuclease domain-containing protein n=1 Tax=Halodesulfovibrio marinisediminis DSM 17456 TaxID=1121457 RepID=A0A1N6JA65_9BACT|nr:relaxase/mobilization nuclease domain-containing protein [Halodesulfovibrio marinisediminis]SIO41244.1 Relaxase/Mobilisation nuclease domain-containing protein [Halodesulfovibrio marinisediminis DSM 17456]